MFTQPFLVRILSAGTFGSLVEYIAVQSSFSVIHKVGNDDIFVQLQMEINW